MKNWIQYGLELYQARKPEAERGKEIEGASKGLIVRITHGIQVSKEKISQKTCGSRCPRGLKWKAERQ